MSQGGSLYHQIRKVQTGRKREVGFCLFRLFEEETINSPSLASVIIPKGVSIPFINSCRLNTFSCGSVANGEVLISDAIEIPQLV